MSAVATDGGSGSQAFATRRWIAAVALGAGIWAVVGSASVFPQLSANSDEGIYLLQADTLRAGRLAPSAPPAEAEAFVPWFAATRDEHYVLKYTPLHAAVLMVGEMLPGPPRVALALVAAAQVVAVAALATELGVRGRRAVAAAALFALSPLVLQLDITYLPYGTSLTLALTALTLALRAARLGSTGTALAAGVVWGFAFFARPYDALLVAVVIAAAVWCSDRRSGFVRTAAAGAVGAVGPVLLLLAFNHAVTGDALQLPFNLLEPADRPGWGDRRALPSDTSISFGFDESVSALGRNLLLVVAWTGGGFVAVALAAWAIVRGAVDRAAPVALLVIWPVGYSLFWGSYMPAFVWDGALFLGPYYYLPLVAIISIVAAAGLGLLASQGRVATGSAVAGMALLSVLVIVPALADQLDRTSQRTALADAIDRDVTPPALVFLPPVYGPYLQNPFSFLRNEPRLGGDTVFALRRDDAGDALVRSLHPDRRAYLVDLPTGWSDQPGFVPVIEITLLSDSE